MISFPFIYNGKEYRSLNAFCKGEGLPYSRTAYRLRTGRPLRDILATDRLGKSRPDIDTAGHPSVKEMAKAAGLKYSCMYSRLRSGRKADEAMQKKIPRRSSGYVPDGKEVEIAGVSYPSIASAATAFGLPSVTVYQRWNRGMRGLDLVAPIGMSRCASRTHAQSISPAPPCPESRPWAAQT